MDKDVALTILRIWTLFQEICRLIPQPSIDRSVIENASDAFTELTLYSDGSGNVNDDGVDISWATLNEGVELLQKVITYLRRNPYVSGQTELWNALKEPLR